jgi:hypothetical protein
MLAAASDKVVIVVVVAAVTVNVVFVPVAVIALAFMFPRPLILSSRRLVVACCFASVAGIFAMRPSFG